MLNYQRVCSRFWFPPPPPMVTNPPVGPGGGRWLCMQCVHGIPPPPVVWVGVGRGGLHMLYGEYIYNIYIHT